MKDEFDVCGLRGRPDYERAIGSGVNRQKLSLRDGFPMRIEIGAHSQRCFGPGGDVKDSPFRLPGVNRNCASAGVNSAAHFFDVNDIAGRDWQPIFEADRAANITGDGIKLCVSKIIAVVNHLRDGEKARQRKRERDGQIARANLCAKLFNPLWDARRDQQSAHQRGDREPAPGKLNFRKLRHDGPNGTAESGGHQESCEQQNQSGPEFAD